MAIRTPQQRKTSNGTTIARMVHILSSKVITPRSRGQSRKTFNMTTQLSAETASTETELLEVARSILSASDYELPVLPEVSVQLLKLTADVDCNPRDIVDLFKRDQSLTGHLLKIANSVRYTSGQTVTSIQQAVARMGLLRVREIVMVISCQSKIFNVADFETDVRESFERSLATAAFSQEIARVRRLNVEDAFLCGLLHDVGRPVLFQSLSDHRTATESPASNHAVRYAADQLRIPMAEKLVRSWDLPERLETIIRNQATPLEAEEYDQQAAILNLAMDLATLALDDQKEMPSQLDHPMIGVLNLYPEDVGNIISQHTTILEWVGATA